MKNYVSSVPLAKEQNTKFTEPGWLRKINTCQKSYTLSFQEMDGVYRYFRSTSVLIDRSENYEKFSDVSFELTSILKKNCFASLLVIKKIIHSLTELGVGPERSLVDRKKSFQIPEKEYYETSKSRKMNRMLEQGAQVTRRNEWNYRLITAMSDNISNGWYPLFGTYTVDPQMLPEGCITRDDLWKNTPMWDRFIKRFQRSVAESLGYGRMPGKWPGKISDWFQYFGVIEHGSAVEQNHPHIHVIFMCKNIPEFWKVDPNSKNVRFKRDIVGASALWEYGWKRETCGVFCRGSWFEENWIPPIDLETGKAIEIGSMEAVACYVTKYMQKGETKKWKWRVKATKSLGLENLCSTMKEIPNLSMLMTLASRQESYSVMMELQSRTRVPLSLIRKFSGIELQERLYSSRSLRAEKLLSCQMTKIHSGFYISLSLSVKNGVRPWKMMSEQLYNCYTPMLAESGLTVQSDVRIKWMRRWLIENFGLEKTCEKYTLLKEEII